LEGPIIVWLGDERASDVKLVGGKAAGLNEMIKAGIPVPPGFIVTTEAYRQFILETGIAGYISLTPKTPK